MASMKEYVRHIWVSYSGQDKELVHSLVAYSHQKENRDANSNLFKLHTYLKEPDDSYTIKEDSDSFDVPYISFLKPGQKISDLVFSIGISRRTIIFLSPSYLESQYCMQELVHCLIRNNKAPLFICKVGFDNGWGCVLESREYSWSEGACVDLYTALAKVYEECVKHDELENHSNKKDWSRGDFKEALDDVISRCSASSIRGGIDLSDGCKETFYQDVIQYLNVESPNNIAEYYLDNRDLRLREWFQVSSLGRFLKNDLNFDSDSFISGLREGNVEQLKNMYTLLRNMSNDEFSRILNSNFEQLDNLINMLLESTLHPLFVCELKSSQIIGAPIYLCFPELEGRGGRKRELLRAQVAYSAARESKLRFALADQKPVVKNAIDFITRPPDEVLSSGEDVVKEVVSKIYSICSEAAQRKIDEVNAGRYSRYDLVAEIDAYQSKESLIIQGCQDSLNDGGEEFTRSVYDALSFINKGLDEEDGISLDFIVFTFDPGKEVFLKSDALDAKVYVKVREILEWANTMK